VYVIRRFFHLIVNLLVTKVVYCQKDPYHLCLVKEKVCFYSLYKEIGPQIETLLFYVLAAPK